MRCDEIRELGITPPLRIDMENLKQGRFRKWIDYLAIGRKEKEWWELFWMMCWNIWLDRNAWVFKRKHKKFMKVVEKANSKEMEYKSANDVKEEGGKLNMEQGKWKTPCEGMYKVLNINTTILQGNQVGVEGVLRDHEGVVVMAMCCREPDGSNAAIAEALSARKGVQIMMEYGFTKLLVEVDCKHLFNHPQKRET